MDRAAASGAFSPASWEGPGAGRLLAAACLVRSAPHGAALDSGTVEALFGVPAAAVAVAVSQVCSALGGNTTAISAPRVLRLYFERLGYPSAANDGSSAAGAVAAQLGAGGAGAAAGQLGAPAAAAGQQELPDPLLPAAGRALAAAGAAAASGAFVGCPPSLTAMALLYAGRVAMGLFPAWPASLRELTGYAPNGGQGELTTPLIRDALQLVLSVQ